MWIYDRNMAQDYVLGGLLGYFLGMTYARLAFMWAVDYVRYITPIEPDHPLQVNALCLYLLNRFGNYVFINSLVFILLGVWAVKRLRYSQP